MNEFLNAVWKNVYWKVSKKVFTFTVTVNVPSGAYTHTVNAVARRRKKAIETAVLTVMGRAMDLNNSGDPVLATADISIENVRLWDGIPVDPIVDFNNDISLH